MGQRHTKKGDKETPNEIDAVCLSHQQDNTSIKTKDSGLNGTPAALTNAESAARQAT